MNETGAEHDETVTKRVSTAGMALDLTATDVMVPHPEPDRDPLPPMPLLFLMTADYKLEAWSIISTGTTRCIIFWCDTGHIQWMVFNFDLGIMSSVLQLVHSRLCYSGVG